jgi:prolyl-tRNA synthetase
VGAMGGKTSQEFVVAHEQGEDSFIRCQSCDYAANVETAEFVREGDPPAALDDLTKVATPDCKTIADVAAFIGIPTSQTVKAVFYWWRPLGGEEKDERFIFALVRGDLEINETKLLNALGGGMLQPASEEEIVAIGAAPGYASTIGLDVAPNLASDGVYVLADTSLTAGGNFVVGANHVGHHFTGANYPRDVTISQMADIAQADTGYQCSQCGGRIVAQRAIEAGHCFKLGTRYSQAVGATYLDENGSAQPIYMGSYGIGLDRLMAVIVECHHDDYGIVWPDEVAPFKVHLLTLGKGDDVQETAESLYAQLCQAGLTVLYDDREASAGVKFNDADLIGIPWRVTVSGRNLKANSVEVKKRGQAEAQQIPLDQLVEYLASQQQG